MSLVDNTMEEKITVAKIPYMGDALICMKCKEDVKEQWNYCPDCGTKLNVGLQ